MLDYNIEYRKNILFIRLIGNLNKNTFNILESELNIIIKKLGFYNIVFNLEGVTNIDTIASNKLIDWSNIINIGEGVSYFCGTNKLNNVNIINNELSAIKEINWKS